MPTSSRDWLATLVARSSTPAERLAPSFVSAIPAGDVDGRLAHWCDRVVAGDGESFARLFASDGLTMDDARRAVADVILAPDAPLPEWAAFVGDALAGRQPAAPAAPDRAFQPERPLPFEEALLPFLRAARVRASPDAPAGWTPAARAPFERVLLEQLARAAAPTLHAAFAAYRAARPPRLAIGAPSRTHYQAFVRGLVGGGWVGVLDRYPVLARVIGQRAVAWVSALRELDVRLGRDRARITDVFAAGAPLGDVVAARAGLSDPHRGGRSVCMLTFASGLRIVYKPRDPGPERAFAELLAWFDARLSGTLDEAGVVVHLRAPAVIGGATDDCAWCEFVAPEPCADERGVARYYRRAGALLALSHVLGAADLHSGNVIAAGEFPMLVDLEVLAAALVRPGGEDGPARRGDEHRWRYWNSVLRTGLLPGRGVSSGGRSYLEGGFAGEHAAHPIRRRTWRHLNTDAMAPVEEQSTTQGGGGPTLAPDAPPGGNVDVFAHRREVARGLEAGLRALAEHGSALVAGPLEALRGCATRAVLRDTRIYDALLGRAMHPRFLGDGVTWAVELDVIRGPQLRHPVRPRLWDAWSGEQRALAALDVPLFETTPCTTELRVERPLPQGPTVIRDAFEESGWDAIVARLAALDDVEIRRQLEFARIALVGAGAGVTRAVAEPVADLRPDGTRLPDAVYAPLDRDGAHAASAAIADLLRALATPGATGTTWVGLVEKPGATRSELRDIGYDLYSGRSGVAIYLAAVAHLTGDGDARTRALDALGPFAVRGAHAAREADDALAALDIGGGSGVGGIVYGLATCGRLLRAPVLIDAARRAAATLTPSRIAADPGHDVLGGAAGAALGLLALHRCAPDDALVRAAESCGHLLRERAVPTAGGLAWPASDGRLLTGFGHGAAGVAHALRTLSAATGDAFWAADAARADAFVDAHFDESAANWLEAPAAAPAAARAAHDRAPRLWCSWCHGAAGIGLGRLSDGVAGHATVSAALGTAATSDFPGADHLCCGTLGRAELLCAAGTAWKRPDLIEAAQRKAGGVVARARRRDGYVTGFAPEYAPAFFQGLAGIGYALLRVAHPQALPSVLLWQ